VAEATGRASLKVFLNSLIQDSFLEATRDFAQFTGKSPEAKGKRVSSMLSRFCLRARIY